jgi:thiamine biosynthesis lipoprotein
MKSGTSRRKFIAITAAAAGVGLLPFGATRRSAAGHLAEWRGLSLGTIATIRIHHPDRLAGERLLARVVSEGQRLEAIFSLYRPDTVLCELNRRGVLVAPPAELADLLVHCDRFWHLTGGLFDPTVQPLWQCYAEHFSTAGASAEGPASHKLDEALRLVGWQNVRFGSDLVVFERRGMALTLNGVAQGYITDRVVDMLREAGIESCLVDMGEIRTRGVHPEGRLWQIALQGPAGTALLPSSIDTTNKAVATSGADGFRFDDDGQCNHLFNPATGRCADPARSLTVVAPTAVAADALSTAFALMDQKAIAAVLARAAETQVYATTIQGTRELTAERGA